MGITSAQREALDVVKDMIDKSNTSVPDYGAKIMTLILGILNVDCRVEPDAPTITDNPDNTLPIDYEGMRGTPRLIIPDSIKDMPTPPFVPGDVTYPNQPPFPPQVWYNQEPEPIQTDKQEDRKYVTEVTHTGGKNGIVYVSNTADVRYNGDFRDTQTSFNEK